MTNEPRPFIRSITKSKYDHIAIYAVHGFWSGSNVQVYHSLDIRTGEFGRPTINWSTGGRDNMVEPEDHVAVACLAKAMASASKLAKKWGSTPKRAKP